MKLRNKKTGGLANLIVNKDHFEVRTDAGYAEYSSLAKLNEEWEDYEDDKFYIVKADGGADSRFKTNDGYEENFKKIGNYFETREEAEKAVEKLKAWKRLKDKDFQFHGHNALGFGEITFSLDFEDMDDEGEIGQLRHDLDLLFGGEK